MNNSIQRTKGLCLALCLALSAIFISACGGGQVKPDENTTSPAKNEVAQFAKEVMNALFAMSDFFGR